MNSFVRAQRNAFVSHIVDRAHDRRGDAPWMAQSLDDDRTRFVVVWQDQILMDGDAPPRLSKLTASKVAELQAQCPDAGTDFIFLGIIDGTVYYGVGIGDPCDTLCSEGRCVGHFLDLRGAALLLDPEEGALAAQAKAMVYWHRHHALCARCGSTMVAEEAGYQLRCSNAACSVVEFPRVDPAIIVLVTSGDCCLLGRQAQWPKGRYSSIAGFVEPGESLETAVSREVWEETGITIRALHYHSSQPWPFPQSLMIGFTAEAASETVTLNDAELEDARWFTRQSLRQGLEDGRLGLPSPYSISFHLIEDWFDEGDCGKLSDILQSGPSR